MQRIEIYADLFCPYAYLVAFRMRKLRAVWRGRIEAVHRSLALEYVNREPTPKLVLNVETPLLMLEEPDIPYSPWSRPDSEWPVTAWPAFEAVKCAERQSLELADELDWRLRAAFFSEHRCVALRHEILDVAETAGLEMSRFTDDFDGGVGKRQVIDEARDGWERLRVPGSPTFVLPSGRQVADLGLPEVILDAGRNQRITEFRPASCSGKGCLDLLVDLIDEAAASTADGGRDLA